MTTTRVNCIACDTMILPATAERFGGLCAQCAKLPSDQLDVKRQIKEGINPLDHAIELTKRLIQRLITEYPNQHIVAIADPIFEAARFYTCDVIPRAFDYDEMKELNPDISDEIELYTSEIEGEYSLLKPIAQELKSISPELNLRGKVAVAASWGMGREEIGWMIRYLNTRDRFEEYLERWKMDESDIDQLNQAYNQELN
ncbi:hypothetical protein [Cerasicoccus fimbriatus]|uniref:hypothetical protein n=1 Tax=Cerasicoccus fimbriatus TaxID=3014554 RepID=UPI0022B3628D|nr:hypothetical protein [Cerasicoccus sp. TK19100]